MGLSATPGGEFSGPLPPPHTWGSRAFGLGVERQGTTLYLRLSGEFDRACIARVEAALERISERLTRRVVFDLQGLSFLDVAGLRTILRANDRTRTEQFDVVVVRPRGFLNRIFTLTRAGERLTMVDPVPPGSREH